MKQTAIEWLIDELDYETISKFNFKLEKAKEMEKEQIIEAFKHGELPPPFVNINAEQYYNETFNPKQNE